jgi:hypothetical protein
MDENDRDDTDIGVLLADPGADSEVLARWSERLGQYVQSQGPLDALRLRPDTEAPWPQGDNPMLAYLMERSAELVEREGADVAIAWLAKHAWFEATITERSRLARLLDDDT